MRRAEADVRRAVSIDPARARAWNLLGALLNSRGDFSESYVASLHAYTADAYLEAREETLLRLAMTAYEIRNDSIAWQWCSAVDPATPQGADCRLTLLAWSDIPSNVAPLEPWALLDRLPESDPTVQSWRPVLMMLVASVVARRDLADSARAVITRARENHPHSHELDLLEAGARLRLGEIDTAAALLRRFVTADPVHNLGVVESRRFAQLRDLVDDLVTGARQKQ